MSIKGKGILRKNRIRFVLKGNEVILNMASMDKMMKECMKPHAIAHLVTGAGIALLLSSYVSAVSANAMVLGIIALVGGIAYDMMVNKG